MHICPNFVFVHPPKTGGTFVSECLQEIFGDSIVPDAPNHGTRAEIPEEHQSKPVLSIVRNPISYYTSVFKFGWWIDRDPGDFDWARWDDREMKSRYAHYPYVEFREFVDSILDLEIRVVADDVRAISEEMPVGQLLLSTLDYACANPTAALRALVSEPTHAVRNRHFGDVTFLHTESLGDDLASFLERWSVPQETTQALTKRAPSRPLNTPEGNVLLRGHGQPYDPSDVSHTSAEINRKILQAEAKYLELFPEYNTA